MTSSVLQRVVGFIEPQVAPGQMKSFVIDQQIATIACDQFKNNFNKNWLQSRCSAFVGVASLIGFSFSIVKFFLTPIPALGWMGVSLILNRIWMSTRNREGYALQNALNAGDENAIIQQLSLGANIYQNVWPYGGAAPGLFQFTKGGSRTVLQYFAEQGQTKVIAYLAMLESDTTTRERIVTEALAHAKDIKTAQLLIDLGADIQKCGDDLLFFCSLEKDLDLMSFFVKKGYPLNAGIDDYEKWEAVFDKRQKRFGGNWDSRDGFARNLHPDFKTPLEELFDFDIGPNGKIESPFIKNPLVVLEALCSDPTVYQNKNSGEAFYHSLNKAGIRIRRANAHHLFELLNA